MVTRVMLVGELIVLAVAGWALASGRGRFSWEAFYNAETFTWSLVAGRCPSRCCPSWAPTG